MKRSKLCAISSYLVMVAVVAAAMLLGVGQVFAATLSVSPSTGVYTNGSTFTTTIRINTSGQAVNAAEATLSFDPAQLAVVNVRRGNTFTLWAVEPSYSNSAGTITFGGGSPSGYTGANGAVLQVTWRAKQAGTARVSFQNGSILAADGRGTNIVDRLQGGSFTITAVDIQPEPEVVEYIAPPNTPAAPNITSPNHRAEDWLRSDTITLNWELPAGVNAVRTLLDENSGSIPTNVYEPPISTITLDELIEGVQYFHLQFRNADGWGRVAHYRIAVDTEAPESFTVTRDDTYDVTSPTQVLRLAVDDTTSPVNRYRVQHNGGEPYEYIDEQGSSTLILSDLSPGQHSYLIEAFDAAGNGRVATLSFVIEAFAAPQWTEYPSEVRPTVVPVFFGETRPGATVYATLTPIGRGEQGASAETYEVQASETGSFRVVPDGRLAAGVYELQAYAVDTHGSQSETTAAVRFAVAPPGYLQFGQLAVSTMSVLVPLVALLVLLGLVLVYGVARIRRVRRYVVAETKDALAVVEHHFAVLRETVATDSEKLQHSRRTKKLTKAEAAFVADLQQHIDDAEAAITKEIAEVDDIVSE